MAIRNYIFGVRAYDDTGGTLQKGIAVWRSDYTLVDSVDLLSNSNAEVNFAVSAPFDNDTSCYVFVLYYDSNVTGTQILQAYKFEIQTLTLIDEFTLTGVSTDDINHVNCLPDGSLITVCRRNNPWLDVFSFEGTTLTQTVNQHTDGTRLYFLAAFPNATGTRIILQTAFDAGSGYRSGAFDLYSYDGSSVTSLTSTTYANNYEVSSGLPAHHLPASETLIMYQTRGDVGFSSSDLFETTYTGDVFTETDLLAGVTTGGYDAITPDGQYIVLGTSTAAAVYTRNPLAEASTVSTGLMSNIDNIEHAFGTTFLAYRDNASNLTGAYFQEILVDSATNTISVGGTSPNASAGGPDIEAAAGITLDFIQPPVDVTSDFTADDSIELGLSVIIKEVLTFADDFSYNGQYGSNITEGVITQAVNIVPYLVNLSEDILISDGEDLLVYKLISIAEDLLADASLDTQATYNVSVAIALTILDSTNAPFSLTLSEAISAVADHTALLRANLDLVDDVLASVQALQNAIFIVDSNDIASATDTPDTLAKLFLDIEEGGVAYVSVRVGDDVISGWVVNTDNFAFSEYQNFAFNSFTKTNGRYFAVAEDGLYELTGDDDDGTPIEASIRTGLLDLGTHYLKDAKSAYVGYTSTGKLVLKVVTTAKGQKEQWWYELKQGSADSVRDGRVTIGRGLRAKYWQLEVVNKDGADFELDDIQLMYNILSRRIR